MKKRGISAVVATILIILIVVVGVGIVWKVVLPLFAELEFLSYSDVRLNIVFQGHTVYDSNQNFAFVQIERGKDQVNVTGVEIGFNFDGMTKTYQSDNVPTPNGKYTYKFNFTNDSEFGIPEDVAPDKVTVAPIFTINNKERLGKILDEKPMPSGRIHLSAEAWKKANDEAAIPIVVTTGSGGGDEPGEPVVPEESEEPGPVDPSIICNDQNNSAYDNGTLIDECEYGCTGGVCEVAPLPQPIMVHSCQELDVAGETYEIADDFVVRSNETVIPERVYGLYDDPACLIITANDITVDGKNVLVDTDGGARRYDFVYADNLRPVIKNVNLHSASGLYSYSNAQVKSGIVLTSSSGEAHVLNNSVDVAYNGIFVHLKTNTNHLIEDNDFTNISRGVFQYSSSGYRVLSYLKSSVSNTYRNNKITDFDTAMKLYGREVTIENNLISRGSKGIEIEGGYTIVENNIVGNFTKF